ncbi:hypothetical protein CFP56_024730, partial [Quercus suber]
LVPTGLAQLQQTPGSSNTWIVSNTQILPQINRLFPNLGAGGLSRENGQCLSSLVDIPRCLTQVFGSLVNGQFSIIDSSCCKAISEIEGNCLSNLFPSNPIFTPLLNNSCGQPSKGNGQVSKITTSKAALPGILQVNQDIQECRSSLSGVPRCLTDVMNSLFNGRVNFFGPTCCKAITLVIREPAPSPLGADQITGTELYMPVKLPFQGLSYENREKDVAKCWSSLSSINRYVHEIYGTLSRGVFSVVGPTSYKSIIVISHKCWPKMFPLNPSFPPLLRTKCKLNSRAAKIPERS